MESAFQFTNPVLTGLELLLNSEFDAQKNSEIKIRINFSVNVEKEKQSNEAVVSLACEIGEQNENSPFWIKAEEQARFRWDEELENDLVDILLNQNAPSLLLAYLRPIVAQVTMASPYGAYNIPFMNFMQEK